ncbi:MAG: hypothetical protein AABX39_06755, partial [Nanoarchaeota archaeon]
MEDFRISQGFGDLVEIWFDEIPEKDLTEQNLEKILQLKKKPIIYKTNTKLQVKLPKNNLGKILKHIKIDYIDLDI